MTETVRRTLWIVLATGIVGLLLLCTLLHTFYRSLYDPIRALETGAGRLAQGDFEYRIDVHTGDELEDLARPVRSTAGAASFRSDNTVERQFEVIDPTVFESNWIPLGRDSCLEQVILQRLKKCL